MARVTVHLNGKRRGMTTPALHNIAGRSMLAREAIDEATRLQHVKAGDSIGQMVSASFDTHWGSMVRTYHPEHDTPDAHEQAQFKPVNGKVEAAERHVTTPRFITDMVQTREAANTALAARRAHLRSLTATRPIFATLKLDPE